jgi:FHS family L-fucose permease-like MFS transporter
MFVLTTLFFTWGFMTVMNDVLIPHLRAVFELGYFQAMLVQSCFFGAYFLGSLAYYLVSLQGIDPLQRIGYKRGLIQGLLLSALGSFLFLPATHLQIYGFYLIALFVLGLGFTLLQIAANPFVALIGEPEGASSRLNLAQAFNSLGTTLAPVIGGALIFRYFAGDQAVRWPYLLFALVLLLQALWVWVTALPEPAGNKSHTHSNALRHPQLRLGMVAIFCYVGAEVAIGSLLIDLLGTERIAGLDHDQAKTYLSLYWGGAMVGRFLGAVSLSAQMTRRWRSVVMVALGIVLFVVLFAVNSAGGAIHLEEVNTMLLLIGANILVFHLAGPTPGRTLGLFSIVAIVLLCITAFGHGHAALWAITAVGLFNSIMWSNIFTLAIRGLGNDTGQGSSLLVMMIVGGAVLPALQGAIADGPVGLQGSFLLLVLCYAYLAYYGFKGSALKAPAA